MPDPKYVKVDGAEGLLGSEVPYLRLGDSSRGPTICVMAGVHGCEYSSMLGLRRFLAGLDGRALQGQIVAVPIANLASFWERMPFVVPHDGLNLNRCFPGDPKGSFTERLAHALFEGVIRDSDFLVDCHAGDQVEALEPFTIYNASPVEERSHELAHAYGLGYCVREERSASPIAGTSAAAAAEVGVPAIIAEVGERGIVDVAAADRHVDGLHRVLMTTGILPGTFTPPPPPTEMNRWVWLRSPIQGWWEPAVEAGEWVDAGGLLGKVSSLTEENVAEVHAPERGVPLFITTSPAVVSDGLLLGLAIG